MKIHELRTLLNNIPNELDDLQVWIDTDESEGGRPVEDVQLKFADDCCLDGDYTSYEFLNEDEVLVELGIDSFPTDQSSLEFTNILVRMGELNYRWEGNQYGEHRFSKKILAIKF